MSKQREGRVVQNEAHILPSITRAADDAALPKYIALSELLIREIAAGRLADGHKLPPERDMAAERGVSVGTLRKALIILEEKGLLERIQGSGNYVRSRGGVESIYGLLRLELLTGGGLPTARPISVDTMDAPADAPFDHGHRIRRLRLLDGTAVAIEEIWVNAQAVTALGITDLQDALYLMYEQRFGVRIARAQDSVGMDWVPSWRHVEFGPQIGEAVSHITRVARDLEGRAVEYSQTWFDAKKAAYINRF
ncbi:GntR family transcriptional regulator [Nereida sp.]|uniref:GntR family transcriptional regulator n=1 Tax=Nereida sp. TaxID=2736090 RepID=UPI003F69FFF6